MGLDLEVLDEETRFRPMESECFPGCVSSLPVVIDLIAVNRGVARRRRLPWRRERVLSGRIALVNNRKVGKTVLEGEF